VTVARLVLVATPIGNLGDLAPRAVEALAGADVIACEDTRRSGRLLQHAGVQGKRLMVVNEHTEAAAAADIVQLVRAGSTVALITDAGTPAISDPGERVVAAMVAADLTVETVPGPVAAIAALTISGLPTARFVMEGFLPRKGAARAQRLNGMVGERRTIVLYEAPHRVARTIADLAETLGTERRIVVTRELTKLHETVYRARLGDAVKWVDEVSPRGEYVLVIEGAPPPELSRQAITDELISRLEGGATRRDAIDDVAGKLDAPRSLVYEIALDLDKL
jgi:16S rRNA (cytidine1402-2'-O)-methyltransferase